MYVCMLCDVMYVCVCTYSSTIASTLYVPQRTRAPQHFVCAKEPATCGGPDLDIYGRRSRSLPGNSRSDRTCPQSAPTNQSCKVLCNNPCWSRWDRSQPSRLFARPRWKPESEANTSKASITVIAMLVCVCFRPTRRTIAIASAAANDSPLSRTSRRRPVSCLAGRASHTRDGWRASRERAPLHRCVHRRRACR